MAERRFPKWQARTLRVAKIAALALLASCSGLVPTDQPITKSAVPASSPSLGPNELRPTLPAGGPLSASGWFRLVIDTPDQDSLRGFDLEVGTLDGRLARTVSVKYGPLTPSASYRGALPVAVGPFGDLVLFAFWDGAGSELHSVSVTTGEDVLLARRDDIIHAIAFDSASDTVFMLTLDPATRAARGIVRLARSLGSEALFLEPEQAREPRVGDQIWKRLWVTPDGESLVVVDCPASDCFVSAHAMDGVAKSRQAMVAGQDVVGVTDDAVVALFGCEPPCAAITYDLATGMSHPVGTFCEAGTIVAVNDRPSLVSDRPVADDCRAGAYQVGRTDLDTGADAPVLAQAVRDRTLVPMDARQGAAPPEGWFLMGPGGQLVGLGDQRNISPSLVRAIDGSTVQLPSLGPPRG